MKLRLSLVCILLSVLGVAAPASADSCTACWYSQIGTSRCTPYNGAYPNCTTICDAYGYCACSVQTWAGECVYSSGGGTYRFMRVQTILRLPSDVDFSPNFTVIEVKVTSREKQG
jgi:hypothetical protein